MGRSSLRDFSRCSTSRPGRECARRDGTVARRALLQIGMGITWGGGLWVLLMSLVLTAPPGSEAAKMRAPWPYVSAASAVVVIAIALIAALGPTLRYVRMRPLETLRIDG